MANGDYVTAMEQEKQPSKELERDRPPGELRSWEQREDPALTSEKRWGRLAKTFVYTVWITVLIVAIVAVVLLLLNPPR